MKNLFGMFIAAIMLTACRTVPLSNGGHLSPMPLTGINWGYPQKAAEQFDLFEEVGIAWLRTDFSWDRLEPRRGVWDFSETDRFCEEALSRGYRIVGVLAFDTPWIHDDPVGKRQIDPDQLAYYLNYVRTVTERYKGMVAEWEIWNEPNLPFNTFWTGKDRDFFLLLGEAASVIRDTDPDAVIMGGSLWRYDKSYITRLYRSGALENVDIFSYHPYYDSPDRILSRSLALEEHLKSLGFFGDFRITEVGFNTYGHLPTSCKPEEQGRLVLESLIRLGDLGHPYLIWYTLYNGDSPGHGLWSDFYGVIIKKKDGSFEYKTGGWALRRYNELIADLEPVEEQILRGEDKVLKGMDVYSFSGKGENGFRLVFFGKKGARKYSLSGFDRLTLYNGATGSVNSYSEDPVILELRKNEPLILDLYGVKDLNVSF